MGDIHTYSPYLDRLQACLENDAEVPPNPECLRLIEKQREALPVKDWG